MPKRIIPILGLMVVWLGLYKSAVLACPCWDELTPSENLKAAGVVFAGRVIATNQDIWRIDRMRFDRQPPFIHLTEDRDWYRSTFEVTKVWKGDVTVRTSVIHPTSGCWSYSFRKGDEYIVYAIWFKGALHTAGIYRNNRLNEAGEDLSFLGAGKFPAPNPSLLTDLPRNLTVLFSFLALLGWGGWRAWSRFGVRKS